MMRSNWVVCEIKLDPLKTTETEKRYDQISLILDMNLEGFTHPFNPCPSTLIDLANNLILDPIHLGVAVHPFQHMHLCNFHLSLMVFLMDQHSGLYNKADLTIA